MGKSKHTIEQKMWAINRVLNHKDSVKHTAELLGILWVPI